MQCASGSYVGTNADVIIPLDFEPSCVAVMANYPIGTGGITGLGVYVKDVKNLYLYSNNGTGGVGTAIISINGKNLTITKFTSNYTINWFAVK